MDIFQHPGGPTAACVYSRRAGGTDEGAKAVDLDGSLEINRVDNRRECAGPILESYNPPRAAGSNPPVACAWFIIAIVLDRLEMAR